MICPKCISPTVMNWRHLVSAHHIPLVDPILLFKELSGYADPRETVEIDGLQGMSEAAIRSLVERDRRKENRIEKLYKSHIRISKELSMIKNFISYR